MDVNDLRSVVTVISLGLFLVLVGVTWSRSRKAAFDEAAHIPFQDSLAGDADNKDGRVA